AERRHRAMPGFTIQPATVAISHYVGVMSPQNAPLRDSFDEILRGAMRDGTLERILRKWSVWNDDQPKLYARFLAGEAIPPVVAALLGLALNYAAYESEIYRSALEAISPGQLEAARTLGLSERQVLTLVRGPQAFRLALAPMTNDFVAMLKDSSLVSVLTVLELTKQTQIFATNLGSWVIPGILCAALCL